MLIAAALLLSARPANAEWFGPATVSEALPTIGNPYSPADNDVHVVFAQGRRKLDRIAYFAHGQWHATLAADTGGEYSARFFVNGRSVGREERVTLRAATVAGFVQTKGTRFRLSTGDPYVPLGHNFGWQTREVDYPKQLSDMGKAGLNWTRVWACSWDSKNPYIPAQKSTRLEIGHMWEPALDKWDTVVHNCEKNGIKLQFVLFHHGEVTTFNDSNWADNPWNNKNGGFLSDPADFFTNSRAKELTRNWLRYAVARWGHSPSVMAWELFNEVQWTNAARDPKRIGDVIAWHREMAAYLRGIDPYCHLVTSSSGESLDARVFSAMDYLQPHTYPPSVFGALLGAPAPKDRPLFFGEFGGNGGSDAGDQEYLAVRDGFWGGLLAGHAGPGQYWFWDRAYRRNLYPEYRREAKTLARCGFAEHPNAQPGSITVTGGVPSDLSVRPGRGWGSTDKFVYDLPADAGTGALPQLSGFIQGAKGGNRTMMKDPIRLRFIAKNGGVAHIRVGQVARAGGELQVSVNGSGIVNQSWPGGTSDRRVNQEFSVPFAAGRNEIVIDNQGSDWVTLDRVEIPGIGPGALAVVLRSGQYALARIQWPKGFGGDRHALTVQGLRDGSYELRQFNLDKGTERSSRVRIRGGTLAGYQPFAPDEGIALFLR